MKTQASFHTLYFIICQGKFVSEKLFLYRHIPYLEDLAAKTILHISTVFFPQGKYAVCDIGCHIKLLIKGFYREM